MHARCAILAHESGYQVYECPSPGRAGGFHFHGDDPAAPYRLLVNGRICSHRHKTRQAAIACTERSHANNVRSA